MLEKEIYKKPYFDLFMNSDAFKISEIDNFKDKYLDIILKDKIYDEIRLRFIFDIINTNYISPDDIYNNQNYEDDNLFIKLYKMYKFSWVIPVQLKKDKDFMEILENY